MIYNKKILMHILIWSVISALLLITAEWGYLFFHLVTEFFSIFIAFAIFMLAVNTRQYHKSNYLVFLGIMYIFVASIDFFHTILYKGMNVLSISSPNYSPSLWLGARYMESISLLILPYLINKKIKPLILYLAYGVITVILIKSVISWHIFPVSFIEGVGLTPFKIISEYVIVAILLLSMFFLYQKRKLIDKEVYTNLFISVLFTILSELCFTLYVDLYAFINQMGHIFKIISFYYIFRAIIVTGLNKPFDTIFRELKQNELELMQSNEKLKNLSEMKDDFLAIASHDLRSPFNAIFGFTELLLQNEELSHDNKHYVELIQKSAEIQLNYINDILDILKVESGNMTLNKKEINIKKLIEDDLQMHKIIAYKKKVSLNFDSGFDGNIFADYEKLVQVLNNLISNALKFSKVNGHIDIKTFLNEKGFLEIHIIDNGIGIPENKINNIFTKYFHIENNNKVNEKSTGLGLSIAKHFVELHGGEIFVKSEFNQGSDFYFFLPLQ